MRETGITGDAGDNVPVTMAQVCLEANLWDWRDQRRPFTLHPTHGPGLPATLTEVRSEELGQVTARQKGSREPRVRLTGPSIMHHTITNLSSRLSLDCCAVGEEQNGRLSSWQSAQVRAQTRVCWFKVLGCVAPAGFPQRGDMPPWLGAGLGLEALVLFGR